LQNSCFFIVGNACAEFARVGGKIQIIRLKYWTMPIELGYLQKSGVQTLIFSRFGKIKKKFIHLTYMYQASYLKHFTQEVFLAIGCSPEEAQLASKVLVSADLRGVDSHGIARLAGYVRLYDHGRLNPNPVVKVVYETPSTAVVDGDRGLGLVVAPKAMEIAMEKAEKVGSGWVSVRNSNHFGIAGYHAMLALEKDMIGWTMTNAAPLVTPTFSLDKLLGTNPIAVAVPANEEPAFVADFASTAVAYGKFEILQRKGLPAPWVGRRMLREMRLRILMR
jgi:L-2-hydroxycarboxylate dehydrogenase (NAD+)